MDLAITVQLVLLVMAALVGGRILRRILHPTSARPPIADSVPVEGWWRPRWVPWAIVGVALLSAIPLAWVLYLLAPQPGDPVNCGGIGFGETPCGWDSVGLTYLFLGVPFLAAVLLLLLLLEVAGPRTHAVRVGVALFFGIVPWASVAVHAVVS